MSETINKMPISIFLWLLTLSFSCGMLWMEVQNQKELNDKNSMFTHEIWLDLKMIQSDLADLNGYVRAREESKN